MEGEAFFSALPEAWQNALKDVERSRLCQVILRQNQPISAVTTEGTFRLSAVVTPVALENFFYRLCRFSLHSYEESICKGYITLTDGCRVGVVGEAVCKEGAVRAVKAVTSLHLRLCRHIPGAAKRLAEGVFAHRLRGLMVAGPPGSGKTTLLRDLCATLAEKGVRVAVVDERRELKHPCLAGCDLLLGYPKAVGAEIALRTLSPQLICMDELGDMAESRQVAAFASGGAYPVLTAHGVDFAELQCRPMLLPLFAPSAVSAVAMLSARAVGQVAELWLLEEGGWRRCDGLG